MNCGGQGWNCDCDHRPEGDMKGYTPRRSVGQNKPDYEYFKLLKLYDNDPYWEHPPWGRQQLIETFTFNHKKKIDSKWYYGDHGSCYNADLFMHPIGEM